ncbi:MAG: EthD family reductase, partial [Pseudomonadota bacterium]
KHFKIVTDHMGPFMTGHSATKGLAGGPETPPGFYAIFNAVFADMAKLEEALSQAGPVLADIPNYYNAQPQMLIGEMMT